LYSATLWTEQILFTQPKYATFNKGAADELPGYNRWL
jgi:hypothetical protein